MSGQLQPIIGHSESEMNNDSDSSYQRNARQTDSIGIPDFSSETKSTSSTSSVTDESQFHCITTKDKPKSNPTQRTETIDNIIKRLDGRAIESGDDMTEYVTKAKFSTLIGDMRVNILSLINLLSTLNKNVTAESDEMHHHKKDMIKLVHENTQLRERLNKLKEEGDRRYNSVCQTYDKKIDTLMQRLDRHDRLSETEHNDANNAQVGQNIRVVKRMQQSGVQQNTDPITIRKEVTREVAREIIRDNTKTIAPISTDDASSSEIKSESNSIMDSNMEAKASKFKVVPTRTRISTGDTFGKVVKEEEPHVATTGASRQSARTEIIDSKINKTIDTKQSRVNRLGLQKVVAERQ